MTRWTRRSPPVPRSSCSNNLTPVERRTAVERCRGRAQTEVSGGVTLADIDTIAALGPDYISVGALTHSAPAIDMSFEIVP